MTRKEKRKIIYNKYGGRCSYCGCELNGKFHVDELLPVRRKQKLTQSGYYHKVTGEKKPLEHKGMNNPDCEWRDSKWVSDGMEHPERLNINNQMPSCPSCNINKHSMSLADFRNLITGFMKHLNEVNTQYKIAKRYGLINETIKPIVFYFERVGK